MINYLILLFILFYLFLLLSPTTEKLRIQGSRDIRGDPYIPYNPYISPWNIGTSFPIRNRRMIIQPYHNELYRYNRPEYDYDSKVKKKLI